MRVKSTPRQLHQVLTPTAHDIFHNKRLALNLLSVMSCEEKLSVLRMMNRTRPDLVRKYVRFLFSPLSEWDGLTRFHKKTGLRQELAPILPLGRRLELEDVEYFHM